METIIISHGDGDGITAAALVYSRYPDSEIKITQPHSLNTTLKKIKGPKKIFILDLAVDTGKFNEVFDELWRLKKEKCEIIFIDHHEMDTVIKMNMEVVCRSVRFTKEKSAAQLCATFNRKFGYLASIGGAADKMIYVNNGLMDEAIILSKSLSFKPDDEKFKIDVVKSLASGKLPSQIPEVVKRAKESDNKLENIMKRTGESLVISTDKYEIYKFGKEIYGFAGNVASILCNKNKTIFVIFSPVNDDGKIVITCRTKNKNINLSEIMRGLRDFGGMGGGHESAASGEIKKEFERDLIKYIKETMQ